MYFLWFFAFVLFEMHTQITMILSSKLSKKIVEHFRCGPTNKPPNLRHAKNGPQGPRGVMARMVPSFFVSNKTRLRFSMPYLPLNNPLWGWSGIPLWPLTENSCRVTITPRDPSINQQTGKKRISMIELLQKKTNASKKNIYKHAMSWICFYGANPSSSQTQRCFFLT